MRPAFQLLIISTVVCIRFFIPNVAFAQNINQFNLNIYNGLPSNNVYNLTIDHYGYLWVPTDKGVARYNGYEAKIFDLSKGFVYKDIWRLFEDKKGRMWLYSISDNIGYIYKDQYHAVTYLGDEGTFYPRSFLQDYKDGICFMTVFATKNNRRKLMFCVEKNDTLHTYDVSKYGTVVSRILNDSELISVADDKNIYLLRIRNGKINAEFLCGVRVRDSIKKTKDYIRDIVHSRMAWFNHYLVSYNVNDTSIRVLDINTYTLKEIYLKELTHSKKNENLKMFHDENETMNAITHKHIYTFNNSLELLRSYAIDSIANIGKEDKISHFTEDAFWGKIIGTFNNGAYFIYNKDTIFKKISDFDLVNFQYVGNASDSVCFWWNDHTRTLARIENNKQILYKNMDLPGIEKIVPYSKDSCLLLSRSKTAKLDIRSLNMTAFWELEGSDAVIVGNELYIVARSIGFFIINLQQFRPTNAPVDNELYHSVVYDPVRQVLMLYNNTKVCIYKRDKLSAVLKRKDLEAMGINSLKKIFVDTKHGNILIQESARLLQFVDLAKPGKVLFDNVVLKDAVVSLRNQTIIAAGTFGVLFSKIEGPGKVSAPIVYQNIKKLKYTIVNDIQVSNDQVMLNTDNGLYQVKIPGDEEYPGTRSRVNTYKLIVTYNDSSYNIGQNDTILVQQKNTKLRFDIINPTGDGKLKYLYCIAGKDIEWHELSADELSIPKLAPGEIYTLSVIASDNQWRSEVRNIQLYIIPYWFEKPLARSMLVCAFIFLVVMIIYLVVIVTKRNVTKKHAKRNQHLELELKSVYSQLNPHFIFNSLSAALYLIKTNRSGDAYTHVYKFSYLLRAYIKSSRNRFITLNEEIKNLTAFIELQQTRFKDKFDFEIILDPALNTSANIPSLLLQPIVENSITHGLLHKAGVGHLKIELRNDQQANGIICIIDDDGVGRDISKQIKEENKLKEESYGSELVKDLIGILNKYERVKIEMEVIDKEIPLTGTIVKLIIKDLGT